VVNARCDLLLVTTVPDRIGAPIGVVVTQIAGHGEPIDEPETSKDCWVMGRHPLGPGYRRRSGDEELRGRIVALDVRGQ
jgi:hypothetical protein